MKYLLVILYLSQSINFLIAQDSISNRKIKKIVQEAHRFERHDKFEKAKLDYLSILNGNENVPFEVYYDLGVLFYEDLGEPEKALEFFRKAELKKDDNTPNYLFYYLGKVNQHNQNYDEAISAYQIYLSNLKHNNYEEKLIQNEIQNCIWSKNSIEEKDHWTNIINLGEMINTNNSEYSPVYDSRDSVMLFTSRRRETVGGNIDNWDHKYYEDMYIGHTIDGKVHVEAVQFNNQDKFTKEVENTKKHDATVSLSPSKEILFIYSDNKLYQSKLKDRHLTSLVKLPKQINISGYQSHASITANDSVLYFTSDKYSKGGIDIFRSFKQLNGEWGKAENLGELINTEYDEESPLISPDGNTLYFASKGHKGLGKFDMFKSSLLENGSWSKPENLGSPINSGGDDLFLLMNDFGKMEYISSNRVGGYGQMDIYYIDYKERPEFADCKIIAKKEYKVHLNALGSIDEEGAPKSYEWLFHDGTTFKGFEADFTYSRPGNYIVDLNVLDNESGMLEYKEDEFTVNIDSVDHIEFLNKDTVSIDSIVNFDASISQLKSENLKHFWWDFGDDSNNYLDTVSTEYQYRIEGDFLVKMETATENTTQRFCVYKPITVLSSEDYKDFSENKFRRDSLLMASNTDNLNEINDRETNLKGVDLSKINIGNPYGLSLGSVYFNFDKSNIRKDANQILLNNLKVLKKYDDIVIKISAHTDSRGSKKYNIKLSEKRAKSTYKWLVSSGIDKERIAVVLFFGEDELIENCPDGSRCSSKQHQLNRRAEITVIGTIKK